MQVGKLYWQLLHVDETFSVQDLGLAHYRIFLSHSTHSAVTVVCIQMPSNKMTIAFRDTDQQYEENC